MACRVFIALSNNDIAHAIRHVTENDIILTDLYCPNHKGQTIEAVFEDSSDINLVSEVSNWFNIQSEHHDFSFGYVNSFYQSCIRCLFGYLKKIDHIIEEKSTDNIVFHLPVSFKCQKPTSNYYLAEYESAGTHLYDRHSFFIPYIKKYLDTKKILYKIGKKKYFIKQPIFNFLRLWGVFILRSFIDIANTFKEMFNASNIKTGSFDKLIIIRTMGQTISMLPYLSQTKESICIIISPSFLNDVSSEKLNDLVQLKKNIMLIKAKQLSIPQILITYANSFRKIFSCNRIVYKYKTLNIDYTQALREIIVMNAGLSIYEKQIINTIKKITANMLFSIENKSPHAFIDSKIAKNLGIPSVQIQVVQQHFFDIPKPVFADYFFCETPKILDNFKESWTKDIEKLMYVGTFQGIEDNHMPKISRKKNNPVRICLFLGLRRQLNIGLLNDFSKFIKQSDMFKIFVKPHPRDSFNYSSILPEASYFKSYKGSFSDFTKQFDVAISFPSGVISDLLFSRSIFLVYQPETNGFDHFESAYLPNEIKSIQSISKLFQKIANFDELAIEHTNVLANFKKNYGILTNVTIIDKNIKDLLARWKLNHSKDLKKNFYD